MRPSSRAARPAPVPAAGAGVSYVMPVLNEERYLEDAVRSILRQRVDEPVEIVLALGPSTDGTADVAQRLAEEDPRVLLVDNPDTDIPAGLNRAIRASRFPTIVRVDAHSNLPDDYTATALEALARTAAANVGGHMRAEGLRPFQRAVARVYMSRFGLGGPSYHMGGAEGPSESAYLGVFRRSVLDEVGLYDESVRRGEDWELNHRIRSAGYTVWFDPRLEVTYRPRETWEQMARQFYATGTWRGELARRLGHRIGVRYFVPPAFVGVVAVAGVTGAVAASGRLTGSARAVGALSWSGVAAYVVGLVAIVTGPEGGDDARDRVRTAVVFPTAHLAWGAGFWNGLVRGAGRTTDTSRVTAGRPRTSSEQTPPR